MKHILSAILVLILGSVAQAKTFPRVDQDLAEYDRTVAMRRAEFAKREGGIENKSWVLAKLQFMYDIDQYMREFSNIGAKRKYSGEEENYFRAQFLKSRFPEMDKTNTADLKLLLSKYGWFRISEFGKAADNNAWILVQHADLDPSFQRQVLKTLEGLLPAQETSRSNYALLFDRVATSWENPKQRKLQRYGTQGQCVAAGQWEPLPTEEPETLDARRAAMDLEPMSDYKKRFKEICRRDERHP